MVAGRKPQFLAMWTSFLRTAWVSSWHDGWLPHHWLIQERWSRERQPPRQRQKRPLRQAQKSHKDSAMSYWLCKSVSLIFHRDCVRIWMSGAKIRGSYLEVWLAQWEFLSSPYENQSNQGLEDCTTCLTSPDSIGRTGIQTEICVLVNMQIYTLNHSAIQHPKYFSKLHSILQTHSISW